MAEWSEDPAAERSPGEEPRGSPPYIAIVAVAGLAVNLSLIWAGYTAFGFWVATLPGGLAWMLLKTGKGAARRRIYGESPISGKALKSPAAWLALFVSCWLVASLWYGAGVAAAWIASLLR